VSYELERHLIPIRSGVTPAPTQRLSKQRARDLAAALAALHEARAQALAKSRNFVFAASLLPQLVRRQGRCGVNELDLQAIRARADAATAGPWRADLERLRSELRDKRNDLLDVRGLLCPNGGDSVLPDGMADIGERVAPAVEWLIDEVERLRTEELARADAVVALDDDLPTAVDVEIRNCAWDLVRAADKMRDDWAETTDPDQRNRELWTPLHRAAETLRDRLEVTDG
jgi:hypothetical protein